MLEVRRLDQISDNTKQLLQSVNEKLGSMKKTSSQQPTEQQNKKRDDIVWMKRAMASGNFQYVGNGLYKEADKPTELGKIWIKKQFKDPKTGNMEDWLVVYTNDDDEVIRKVANNVLQASAMETSMMVTQILKNALPNEVIDEDKAMHIGYQMYVDHDLRTPAELESHRDQIVDMYKSNEFQHTAANPNPKNIPIAPGIKSKNITMDETGGTQNAKVTIEFTNSDKGLDFYQNLPGVEQAGNNTNDQVTNGGGNPQEGRREMVQDGGGQIPQPPQPAQPQKQPMIQTSLKPTVQEYTRGGQKVVTVLREVEASLKKETAMEGGKPYEGDPFQGANKEEVFTFLTNKINEYRNLGTPIKSSMLENDITSKFNYSPDLARKLVNVFVGRKHKHIGSLQKQSFSNEAEDSYGEKLYEGDNVADDRGRTGHVGQIYGYNEFEVIWDEEGEGYPSYRETVSTDRESLNNIRKATLVLNYSFINEAGMRVPLDWDINPMIGAQFERPDTGEVVKLAGYQDIEVMSTNTLMNKIAMDVLEGGVGDDKNLSDFNKKQVNMGREVEKEHTDDEKIAEDIVKDHLTEDNEYYDKLNAMEKGSRLFTEQELRKWSKSPPGRKHEVEKLKEEGVPADEAFGIAWKQYNNEHGKEEKKESKLRKKAFGEDDILHPELENEGEDYPWSIHFEHPEGSDSEEKYGEIGNLVEMEFPGTQDDSESDGGYIRGKSKEVLEKVKEYLISNWQLDVSEVYHEVDDNSDNDIFSSKKTKSAANVGSYEWISNAMDNYSGDGSDEDKITYLTETANAEPGVDVSYSQMNDAYKRYCREGGCNSDIVASLTKVALDISDEVPPMSWKNDESQSQTPAGQPLPPQQNLQQQQPQMGNDILYDSSKDTGQQFQTTIDPTNKSVTVKFLDSEEKSKLENGLPNQQPTGTPPQIPVPGQNPPKPPLQTNHPRGDFGEQEIPMNF
jgi:hypothetical protein